MKRCKARSECLKKNPFAEMVKQLLRGELFPQIARRNLWMGLVLSLCFTFSVSGISGETEKGLIGYWNFDEDAGAKVKDSAGNNYGILLKTEDALIKSEDFNHKQNEWVNLKHREITSGSDVLKEKGQEKSIYIRGKDYEMDYAEGKIRTLAGGNISELSKLTIEYHYSNPGAKWVDGKKGKALEFDGRDDGIDCGKNASLNLTEAITIEAWVKFSEQKDFGGLIVGRRIKSGDWLGFGYALHQKYPGRINATVSDGIKYVTVSVSDIKNDTWYHVAMTANGGKLNIYLNGELKGSQNYNFAIKEGGSTYIGTQWGTYSFNGIIDEVKIFSDARTNDEIIHDMGNNSGAINVGIYNSGYGANGIYQALSEEKGIKPELIRDMSADTLSKYRVVIFPAVSSLTGEAAEWAETLRSYVKNGYGLLLTHNSCGYKGAFSDNLVFPETHTGIGKENTSQVKVKDASHPVCKGLPGKFKCGYADHIYMQLGKAATCVIADEKKNNVVVAGKFGKGKILAAGMPIGYESAEPGSFDGTDAAPSGAEKQLLINGVKWLAEGTVEKALFLAEKGKNKELFEEKENLRKRNMTLRAAFEDFKYQLLTNLFIIEIDAKNITDEKEKQGYIEQISKLQNDVERESEVLKSELDGLFSKNGKDRQSDEDFLKKVKNVRMKIEPEIEKLSLLVTKTTKKISYKEDKHWAEQFQRGIYAFHQMTRVAPYCDENIPYRPSMSQTLKIAGGDLAATVNYLTHIPWGENINIDKDKLKKLLDWHAENNIKAFFNLKFKSAAFHPKTGWNNTEETEYAKEFLAKVITACNGHPGFGGFIFDEPSYSMSEKIFQNDKEYFKKYLKGKYTREEQLKIGINIDSDVESFFKQYKTYSDITSKVQGKNRVLWLEYEDFATSTLKSKVRELIDYAHSLQKDVLVIPLMMITNVKNYATIAPLEDYFIIDYGGKNSRDGAFFADSARLNCRKGFWFMPGYYSSNQSEWERNIALAFVHTDGFWIWEWESYWKYPPRPAYSKSACVDGDAIKKSLWRPSAWQPTEKLYQKAHKIKEYLYPTTSGAGTAIILSVRSMTFDKTYLKEQQQIYNILTKYHIQPDIIYAEGLTPDKIKQYKTLLIIGAKCLLPEQVEILKQWTAEGGNLIASGQATLFDRWGNINNDYILSDVYGITYKGENKVKIDSVELTENNIIKANQKLTKIRSKLNEMNCDIITPTSAKAIAYWAKNIPAIIVNKYKKGNAFFISAQKGLSEINWFDENIKDIPFLIPLIKNCCKDSLPFESINCPKEVEINLRLQEDKGRKIIHLLNHEYISDSSVVKGIEISVKANQNSNVFYASDKQKISFIYNNNEISFSVRNFALHEIIVIETSSTVP